MQNLKKQIGRKLEQLMLKDLKKTLFTILKPVLHPHIRILDIGCEKNGSINYNTITYEISLTGYDSSAIDIELFAKNYAAHTPHTAVVNVETVQKLPPSDLIITAGLIQYLEKPERVLTLIYETLTEDGYYLFSTLNRENWLRRIRLLSKEPKTDKGEQHLYDMQEIEQLLEHTGFKILTKKGSDIIPLPMSMSTNLIYLCKKK